MRFHYFDPATGEFTGMRGKASAAPDGLASIADDRLPADFHWRMWRVSADGNVVRCDPPKPSVDARWCGPDRGWVTATECAGDVRAQRDLLMRQCDWVVARAIETQQPVPESWRTYRQALRDVTEQPGFPFDLVWPVQPAT